MFSKKSITETLASLLIFLFIYTAISKYMDYARFSRVLSESPLLENFSTAIAIALPALEIVVSVLLIIPKTRLKGFAASFILMTLFTGYLIYMVTLGGNIPCSCGGVLQSLTWNQHIVLNFIFLAIAGAGFQLQRRFERQKQVNQHNIARA